MEWIRVLMLSSTLVGVTDGDTLKLPDGQGVRLQGFNAPEIFSPKCEAEKTLGLKAKARLTELIKQDGVRLVINPGNCAYGRLCGTLLAGAENVGDILIREELAEPMVCPGNRCPKARDWCTK